MALLTTMKGIPLAYNKDMQEDKEMAFDAMDTVNGCIQLFDGMLETMTFREDVMEKVQDTDLRMQQMQQIIW